VGAALACVVVLSACEPPSSPPNIVVISIDTLRRDHVSAYGYDRETTPRIDALAVDGALFLDAVSTSNWTLPSHMSLMTGLPPSVHRVEDDRTRLFKAVGTLPQALSHAGYATAGIASHVYLGEKFGFARGFDHYANTPDQAADAVTDQAIAWLESQRGESFFLFLHYFDPHWGYAPPEPFRSRFGAVDRSLGTSDFLLQHLDPELPLPEDALPDILRLYDGEIAFTDSQIGRVVDWLRDRGELDRTIIAVTSDHGEEFGDHGSFGHATHLYGEVTRIPLVLRYPPALAPGARAGAVSLTDLPLTLLSLAGVRAGDQFGGSGHNISAPLEPARKVVTESTRWGPKRFAIQDARMKLVTRALYSPTVLTKQNGQIIAEPTAMHVRAPALFDVSRDEGEVTDLLPSADAAIGKDLQDALLAYVDLNVPALKLTCIKPRSSAAFTVEVTFDGPLADEPFDPLSQATLVSASRSPGQARIHLAPESEGSTLFLPISPQVRNLTIALFREEELVYRQSTSVPTGAETRHIDPTHANEPSVLVAATSAGRGVSPEASNLSDAELNRLRALGYAE
jgi:arylsulfatase A-like enzyme